MSGKLRGEYLITGEFFQIDFIEENVLSVSLSLSDDSLARKMDARAFLTKILSRLFMSQFRRKYE